MNYVDFDNVITAKHGIVLENWPLKTFCSPSDLKTLYEVQALYNAFKSGATRFRLLSNAELQAWSDRRFEQALTQTDGSAGASANVNESEGSSQNGGSGNFILVLH